MSKLITAMVAIAFASSAIAGGPERFEHRGGYSDRGHAAAYVPADNRHDSGRHGRLLGLGLLAGTAIILAATHANQVTYAPAVSVYAPPVVSSPPVVVYSGSSAMYPAPPAPVVSYVEPTNRWWYYCAQPAGYYPHVSQCRSGWTKVAPLPSN